MKKSILFLILIIAFANTVIAQCNCDELPPPEMDEATVYVNNTGELQNAIDNANSKTTIFLNSGTYNISNEQFIIVNKPEITIRSTTGNRDDVIVQGNGMAAPGVEIAFYVDADNVTIADLTVRDVANHGFFVNPGSDNCLFHNVRGLDCGEQIFKATGGPGEDPKNNGIIECSTFEYTTTLDDGDDGWYTNGIDLLYCHNWIIRDNIIKNIKHNPAITSTLAGPAILIWNQSSNTIIERNRIIECDFGIAFGNSGQGGVSHTGGIIRNNFITGYSESDFGIGLTFAPDAKVINNTVFSPGSWPYSIEARFPETNNCLIMNNFCDEEIFDDRDGASCTVTTNNIEAVAADFVDVNSYDLHLAFSSIPVINAGTNTGDRIVDIDCENIVDTPDIGADEYDSITSVVNVNRNNIAIFPNPSTGKLKVTGKNINRIKILNVNGQIIKNLETCDEKNTIDLSEYPKGIYFLEINTGNSDIFKKIIFQ